MIGESSRGDEQFFAAEAERIAALSLELARRFRAGGRLIATASSLQDRSDAHHVAVEFVHPVIVGKRALSAVALAPPQAALVLRPVDALIVFGPPIDAPAGCLTIGFEPGASGWTFEPPSADPFVRQELVETLYHVLWETVHVFLEHLDTSSAGGGASSFLYPFLEGAPIDLDAVLEDVSRSVVIKAAETSGLRRAIVGDGSALDAAASAVRDRVGGGGKLLAFGNGGSATDAMDLVADLGDGGVPALDLAADAAVLTALANDVGPDVLFQRQVIAHASETDVAVAFSTSGGSSNVVLALQEARRRGLETIAFVGYGGGSILAEGVADHVLTAPSEYVPRIQEAHATAYHRLCELVLAR